MCPLSSEIKWILNKRDRVSTIIYYGKTRKRNGCGIELDSGVGYM